MSLLVSVEEAKMFLGITNNEKDDRLSAVLEGVSAAAEAHLGRYVLEREIADEEHCFTESVKTLRLNHYPVREILRISVNGENKNWSAADYSAGIVWGDGGFSGRALVSYRAGLAAGITDVPRDIKIALCLWAKEIISKDNFIKSESLGDYSVSYESSAMPPAAAALLAPYRGYSL